MNLLSWFVGLSLIGLELVSVGLWGVSYARGLSL